MLYSTAFRRLAGITQVVHASEGHVFHNRLTHSLKVAQVGRRLTERLIHHTDPELIIAMGGVDPNIVETASLAHDLGHPPFGHAAESELDKLIVEEARVSDGFEGNPQSFRIVTKLEVRNAEFPGLNLTSACLDALLKYPNKRAGDSDDPEHRKWGYYFSEKSDFEFARARQPTGDSRQSAEAALMDWSDDVSYAVHDLDDSYRAGFVPLDQLLQPSRERERFARWYETTYHPAHDVENTFEKLSILADRVLHDPFDDSSAQLAALNGFTTLLLQRYLGYTEPDAVKLADDTAPRLVVAPELRAEVKLLKSFMRRYVYDHPALRTHQRGQRAVVRSLWRFLTDAVNDRVHGRGLIPLGFRDAYDQALDQSASSRARLVTDIISSMTERQALQLHHRITGIAPGSIYDRILRR